jgi:hypothetical protein
MTEKYVGYAQFKAILGEILEFGDYPNQAKWDFLNGVLSCEEVLGDYQLWLHWGQLRIVPSELRYKDGLTAGDCKILQDWNTEKDGTITLIGKGD